jgi:hypothetical protein
VAPNEIEKKKVERRLLPQFGSRIYHRQNTMKLADLNPIWKCFGKMGGF